MAFRQALEARLGDLARSKGVDVQRLRKQTAILEGAPYGGARYPVEVRMAGRIFARFHLDVASGDPVLEPIQTAQGGDWLAFAGLGSVPFLMISKEQQFAEKLHAYTLPRDGRSNSRVRDLVDMFLLVQTGMDAELVRDAIQAVFKRRGTHPSPDRFTAPPADWALPFGALAKECGLDADARDAYKALAAFCAAGSIL